MTVTLGDCEIILFFPSVFPYHISFGEEEASSLKIKVSLLHSVPGELMVSDVAVPYFERVRQIGRHVKMSEPVMRG